MAAGSGSDLRIDTRAVLRQMSEAGGPYGDT